MFLVPSNERYSVLVLFIVLLVYISMVSLLFFIPTYFMIAYVKALVKIIELYTNVLRLYIVRIICLHSNVIFFLQT